MIIVLVPSLRTDFFADMLGKILSRRRQLSTKQWSGNSAVMFQPKSKLQVTRWIIGIGHVNSDGLSVKHAAALALTGHYSQTVKPF